MAGDRIQPGGHALAAQVEATDPVDTSGAGKDGEIAAPEVGELPAHGGLPGQEGRPCTSNPALGGDRPGTPSTSRGDRPGTSNSVRPARPRAAGQAAAAERRAAASLGETGPPTPAADGDPAAVERGPEAALNLSVGGSDGNDADYLDDTFDD